MILRNKKTGVIKTRVQLSWFDGSPERYFESLEQAKEELEEWEDYKEAEPLIKDKKVRKAVRAWAEAEEIEKVFICDDLVWGEPMVRIAEDTAYHEISFKGSLKIKCGTYTITDLCGEEE